MDTVWLLWFEQEWEDGDDTELLIGVYRTEADALAAKERVKYQPGFRGYLDGFTTSQYEIGEDHWTEGFVRSGPT
jgi:hypothetical protein